MKSGEVMAPSGINLRASPQGRKIGAIARGTDFIVLKHQGNWLKVRTSDGEVGYIWSPAGVQMETVMPVPKPVPREQEQAQQKPPSGPVREKPAETDTVTAQQPAPPFSRTESPTKTETIAPADAPASTVVPVVATAEKAGAPAASPVPMPVPRPSADPNLAASAAGGAVSPEGAAVPPKADGDAGAVPNLKPDATNANNDMNQLVTTARGGLMLRSGPGTRYSALGKIDFGRPINPLGPEKNGWVEVEIAGHKGWVSKKYITESHVCTNCDKVDIETGVGTGFTAAVREITDKLGIDTGKGPLPYAKQLQSKLRVGYRARRNLCWRAVWEDLKAAGLVRGELTQNSAKNALIDLSRHGFEHDPNACGRPGVVRVYGGTSVPVPKRYRTAGDTHGHIEILGTDGRFHHFTSSGNSIQARFGKDRRPLKYCLVKK